MRPGPDRSPIAGDDDARRAGQCFRQSLDALGRACLPRVLAGMWLGRRSTELVSAGDHVGGRPGFRAASWGGSSGKGEACPAAMVSEAIAGGDGGPSSYKTSSTAPIAAIHRCRAACGHGDPSGGTSASSSRMSLCMAQSLNDSAGKAADIGGGTHTFSQRSSTRSEPRPRWAPSAGLLRSVSSRCRDVHERSVTECAPCESARPRPLAADAGGQAMACDPVEPAESAEPVESAAAFSTAATASTAAWACGPSPVTSTV